MKNKEIAQIFKNMARLLEVKGDNIFKIRAYYRTAENILALGQSIEDVKKENRFSSIPGIGKTLQTKIIEFLDTGKISAYERLIKEIPEGILDIIDIPSVGPKKAKLFFDELNVKNPEDLRKAAEEGRLLGLAGIKEKTVENILRGIRILEQGQKRLTIGIATEIANIIINKLTQLPQIRKIKVAGSLRRMKETIGDIDILVDSSNPQKVMETFIRLPQVKRINAQGETKSSVFTHENVQVDLRVVDPKCFGAALLYFTGSKSFNIRLRQMAIKKKMKINEYGVFGIKGKKEHLISAKTEEECFKSIGIDYIPPELREDIGATELFAGGKLPQLIEHKDIKGDLHVHSNWSDGRDTIDKMLEAAQKRGYQYLAISDHSVRLRVGRGLSEADLINKKKEIERLNAKLKNFWVLFGTEVEIDKDGNLDYNDGILSNFDFVIAAIHTKFDMSKGQMTARLAKTIKNKHVHAIAHPTGRHFGKREPCDIDLKEICKMAADTNTFLEINAFPVRLDLDSSNIYFARKQGVKFTINTDAHDIKQLDLMKFGVGLARRGWLINKDVLNTLSLKDLKKALTIKKSL